MEQEQEEFDEQIALVEQLMVLIDERESIRLEYNKQIADVIGPTLLTAITNLIDLPAANMRWVDIEATELAIIVAVQVTYTAEHELNPFMLTMLQVAPPDLTITRVIRIATPIAVAFDPPSEIMDYLTMVTNSRTMKEATQTEEYEPLTEDDTGTPFDDTVLTKEQVEQMMLFQHLSRGKQQ